MTKVHLLFIMFIYLSLHRFQLVIAYNRFETKERKFLFGLATEAVRSPKSNPTKFSQFYLVQNNNNNKNNNDNYFSSDEVLTGDVNPGDIQSAAPRQNKATFDNNGNEYGNELKSKESEHKRNTNKETLTTDFSLISSDFNAKDKCENSSNSASQSNVPEKIENNFNNLDDLDQLSFINNSKNDCKRKEKQISLGESDLDVELSPLNLNAEYLFKKQKDLLSLVTDFGLQQMHELYDVKEKEIFEAGLFLPKKSPGSYLAAFNQQSAEVKNLSRFAYASLKATGRLMQELAGSKLRQEIFNVTDDATKDWPEISLLDTSLHDNCPLKNNPGCPPWNHLYRTFDGTCNNMNNPWWGAKFQPLTRFLAPHYSDGLEAVRESVRGGSLPSPRLISASFHWDKDINSRSITHMFMQWGQFIDHDMTSSSQSRGFRGSVPKCCDAPLHLQHPDCLPIEVPRGDRFFSRFGIRCLEFLRSAPSSRVGCVLGPREQINQVTSYIDGSMIYGNSEREASKLRLFRNGRLKYTRMPQRLPLLPVDVEKGEICRNPNPDFFCLLSGDGRMNEQPGLIAIHIVFLRLHNRLTRYLARLNPEWSDERLFQETRKIVGAILQHITYKEFLPIVLGQDVMNVFDLQLLKTGYYNGYSELISGSAANAFATAAFRFGHSMVQGKFLRWDDIRKEGLTNVSLHNELQDSGSFHRFGAVDSLIMGMCIQGAQQRDEFFTEELTNHLFQTPSFPAGLDLAAINIQRGRDHGLPSYNSWRNPCGLRKIRTWDELLHVMPEESRDGLRRIYKDVNDIDLYTGGLAEFSVKGGIVGSTFACIIGQNFRKIKKGDRFWYENGGFENSFTPSQLRSIRRITLARILCDNLDLIEEIQPFVFLTEDNLRNPKLSCSSRDIPFIDLSPWEETPRGKWNEKSKSSAEVPLFEMSEMDSGSGNEIPKPFE